MGAYYTIMASSLSEKAHIKDKMLYLEFYASHKDTCEQMRSVLRAFQAESIVKFEVID